MRVALFLRLCKEFFIFFLASSCGLAGLGFERLVLPGKLVCILLDRIREISGSLLLCLGKLLLIFRYRLIEPRVLLLNYVIVFLETYFGLRYSVGE